MSAELIAVGTELLRGDRADTNSAWLYGRLERAGIAVTTRTLVDDDAARIGVRVREALAHAAIVILTGGLGPTQDDQTREGLSRAFEAPLERDPVVLERLRGRFAARGRPFTSAQARQADRPAGFAWLDNPLGTAPGLLLERDGRMCAALPGVPAEMRAMFDAALSPRMLARGTAGLARRVLKVAGRFESDVDRLLDDVQGEPGLETTILATAGGCELVVRARGADPAEAEDRLAAAEHRIRERLGADVYAADDDTLAQVVGRLLVTRGATVAAAESCTGGLLGAALTDTPGSSAWYRGGLIVYADELKRTLAGVDGARLSVHGAVSREVALDLAEAARARCGADYGLGVTGVAGPGGGTASKPVGRVHLALATARDRDHWQVDLSGDRTMIRRAAVAIALDRLRRRLLDEARTSP